MVFKAIILQKFTNFSGVGSKGLKMLSALQELSLMLSASLNEGSEN